MTISIFFIKHTLENLNGRIIMNVFIRAKHLRRNTQVA